MYYYLSAKIGGHRKKAEQEICLCLFLHVKYFMGTYQYTENCGASLSLSKIIYIHVLFSSEPEIPVVPGRRAAWE